MTFYFFPIPYLPVPSQTPNSLWACSNTKIKVIHLGCLVAPALKVRGSFLSVCISSLSQKWPNLFFVLFNHLVFLLKSLLDLDRWSFSFLWKHAVRLRELRGQGDKFCCVWFLLQNQCLTRLLRSVTRSFCRKQLSSKRSWWELWD